MRRWEVAELGYPPSVARLAEVAEPVRGDGRALVRIDAACIGFPDYLMMQGLYHDKPDLPFGIAGEAAGTVIESDIDGIEVGSRRLVLAEAKGAGLLTDVVSALPDNLLPLPADMPVEHGATLFTAYQTSYVGLFRRARLDAGETVLIHGAAGGVGMAAVQLAKAAGAHVIAVVGGAQKVDAARDFGADEVIDHQTTDFVERVRELTGGRGVDVAYDPVGGEVFDQTRRVMAVEGRLLVVGFAGGTIPSAPANHALLKNYSVVGFRMRPFREDLAYRDEVHRHILQWYAEGKIRPRVHVFDFDSLPAALTEIGSRQVIGRVVLRTQPRP